jgi:hypothetical protein
MFGLLRQAGALALLGTCCALSILSTLSLVSVISLFWLSASGVGAQSPTPPPAAGSMAGHWQLAWWQCLANSTFNVTDLWQADYPSVVADSGRYASNVSSVVRPPYTLEFYWINTGFPGIDSAARFWVMILHPPPSVIIAGYGCMGCMGAPMGCYAVDWIDRNNLSAGQHIIAHPCSFQFVCAGGPCVSGVLQQACVTAGFPAIQAPPGSWTPTGTTRTRTARTLALPAFTLMAALCAVQRPEAWSF